MARNLENRSISFDPQVFEAMETKRTGMLMSRSEFVQRCVMKYLAEGSKLDLEGIANALPRAAVPYARQDKRKKK